METPEIFPAEKFLAFLIFKDYYEVLGKIFWQSHLDDRKYVI
jgi:hypothetical protein